MKILCYSTKPYEEKAFTNIQHSHKFEFLHLPLNSKTANLAKDYDAVCAFVNDDLNTETLNCLKKTGVKFILLRCAGFNQVNLKTAKQLGFKIARVPAYSPYAVAEHATALLLAINRKIHKAYNRVREDNFSLNGLVGFDIYGKTIGVIGAGKIGQCFINIMNGFGANVIYHDPGMPNLPNDCKAKYADLDTIFSQSDVISLHCPLTAQTKHLLNQNAFQKMKPGVLIINTGRGGLIDSQALILALKTQKLGGVGLDVYEDEANLFFEDHSIDIIQDDIFQRLLTFPNVIITGHQGFLTEEALNNIATTTLKNATELEDNGTCINEISIPD